MHNLWENCPKKIRVLWILRDFPLQEGLPCYTLRVGRQRRHGAKFVITCAIHIHSHISRHWKCRRLLPSLEHDSHIEKYFSIQSAICSSIAIRINLFRASCHQVIEFPSSSSEVPFTKANPLVPRPALSLSHGHKGAKDMNQRCQRCSALPETRSIYSHRMPGRSLAEVRENHYNSDTFRHIQTQSSWNKINQSCWLQEFHCFQSLISTARYRQRAPDSAREHQVSSWTTRHLGRMRPSLHLPLVPRWGSWQLCLFPP